jgi:6-phosphogluconolactonase (cycloisomerase 2 family)
LTAGDDYLLTTHVNSGTVVAFAVNKTAGTLTPLTSPPVPTGPAGSHPVGISFNRRNNVFYTTNTTGGPLTVAAFRLDSATGAITPVGPPVDTNGADTSVILHQSGRFLFQYNRLTPSIQRYALDATTGAPTLMTEATALPGATSVSMFQDVSGKYLYVTSPGNSTLSSYSIDAATGALTLINSVSTSPGGQAMVPFLLQ